MKQKLVSMQDNDHNFLYFNEKFIVQRQKMVTVDKNWIIR